MIMAYIILIFLLHAFSTMMNSRFKSIGTDAMMIPMNIRADDFYFTVSGLRKAKLDGVIIGKEYRHDVLDLCDFQSSDVQACGFCDILNVKEGKLYGDIFIGKALCTLLKEKSVNSLALYGSGALAKSILLHVKQSGTKKVTLFNDRIESCMELIDAVGDAIRGIEVDIERTNTTLPADFSPFDLALNVANQEELFSPVKSSKIMVDLSKSGSPFSMMPACEYLGYDDILTHMNERACKIFEGKE